MVWGASVDCGGPGGTLEGPGVDTVRLLLTDFMSHWKLGGVEIALNTSPQCVILSVKVFWVTIDLEECGVFRFI